MFKFDKYEKRISLNRGETAEFNVTLPIKDDNGYVKYSSNTEDYWYDETNKKLYDSTYKKVSIPINTLTKQLNVYNEGDVIRFKVFEADNTEKVYIEKDFEAVADETAVMVNLTSEDTTIEGLINEYVDYWYEIELNPDTRSKTIVGFDDNGAKIFRLFPEGGTKQ